MFSFNNKKVQDFWTDISISLDGPDDFITNISKSFKKINKVAYFDLVTRVNKTTGFLTIKFEFLLKKNSKVTKEDIYKYNYENNDFGIYLKKVKNKLVFSNK